MGFPSCSRRFCSADLNPNLIAPAFDTANIQCAGLTVDSTCTQNHDNTDTFDVKVTNVADYDLRAPLMLVLDPGRYFQGSAQSAGISDSGLWLLDVARGESRNLVSDDIGLDGYTWLPDSNGLVIGVHRGRPPAVVCFSFRRDAWTRA